jgi:uncharacterized protein YihD (DUF1040 family)
MIDLDQLEDKDLELSKVLDRVVEHVKDLVYNDKQVNDYVNDAVQLYHTDMHGIDRKGPLTNLQEDYINLATAQIVNMILAKVMVS